MDDKMNTMLMKKQNMPDKKVIDFLTIHTSDFRDVSNFLNLYVCSHRIIKFHLANFHVNWCL